MNESYELPEIETTEEDEVKQNIEDVLKQLKEYLTKEELLYIAVYKNSYKPRNSIYRVFLEKYRKKRVGLSTICMQKKRMLVLLDHLNRFLKFKKENSMDLVLKNILTRTQFRFLMQYERRKLHSEIQKEFNISKTATVNGIKRAIGRLANSKDPLVEKYLHLLKNVMKFSRKNKSIIPSK